MGDHAEFLRHAVLGTATCRARDTEKKHSDLTESEAALKHLGNR